MKEYAVFVMESTSKGFILHSRINLSHLVPPVVEKAGEGIEAMLDMAKEAVSFHEGPKLRCDLQEMRLVEPNPVVETIMKLEGPS